MTSLILRKRLHGDDIGSQSENETFWWKFSDGINWRFLRSHHYWEPIRGPAMKYKWFSFEWYQPRRSWTKWGCAELIWNFPCQGCFCHDSFSYIFWPPSTFRSRSLPNNFLKISNLHRMLKRVCSIEWYQKLAILETPPKCGPFCPKKSRWYQNPRLNDAVRSNDISGKTELFRLSRGWDLANTTAIRS